MAEIVNLRRVKKQRARAEAAEQAAQNRVQHGRTAQEKRAARLQEDRRVALLDGARLHESGASVATGATLDATAQPAGSEADSKRP